MCYKHIDNLFYWSFGEIVIQGEAEGGPREDNGGKRKGNRKRRE